MSGRAGRRLLKARQAHQVIEEEEESDEVMPLSYLKFRGLEMHEPESNEEFQIDFHDEKKPQKKRGRKKTQNKTADEILEEYLQTRDKSPEKPQIMQILTLNQVLAVKTEHLDYEQEISRRFGPQVIGQTSRSRIAKTIIQAQPGWPKYEKGGLSIEKLAENTFKLVHGPRYKTTHMQYLAALERQDYNGILALNSVNPWHIESIFTLAHIVEGERATELVTRALYACVQATGDSFAWTGSCPSALPYKYAENRIVHLCMHKYIRCMAKRACWRTALEWAKRLLALDPTDPTGLLTQIDALALRASLKTADAEWYLEFCRALGEPMVNSMPNLDFGRALALRIVESPEADATLVEAARRHPRVHMFLLSDVKVDSILERLFIERHAESMWAQHEIREWTKEMLSKLNPSVCSKQSIQNDAIHRNIVLNDVTQLFPLLPAQIRRQTDVVDPVPPKDGVPLPYEQVSTGFLSSLQGLVRSFLPSTE